MTRLRLVAIAIALALSCGGCTQDTRTRVVLATSASHSVIAAVQDAERALCGQTIAVPTQCTNPQAVAIGLTDARHQAINASLATVYRGEIKFVTGLQTWQPGQAEPAGLDESLAAASNVLDALTALAPGSAQTLLSVAHQLLQTLSDLRQSLLAK